MSDSWHPLKDSDVTNIVSLIAQFNSRSPSGIKRIQMSLFLWSRLTDERNGVPYFDCGRPTIAKKCGVSQKTVQKYLEQMESDGWIIRLSKAKNGRRVRRTFAWLTDDGEVESRPQKGSPPDPKYLQKGSPNLTPRHSKKGHQHSTQYTVADETPPTADACAGFPAEEPPEINYEPVVIDPRELGPLVFPEVP